MVRFQIMSDLHMEMDRPSPAVQGGSDVYPFDITPQAPILLLLGDIGYASHDRLYRWLDVQLGKFETVVFVPGNHEFYRSSINEGYARMDEYAQGRQGGGQDGLGRFVLLSRGRLDVFPNVTLLGCTLWTALDRRHLDVIRMGLNDFRAIGDGFSAPVYSSLHEGDLAWLNQTILGLEGEEATLPPDHKVVILTHHVPVVEGTSDPRFDGSPFNSAFRSDLSTEPCYRSPRVKMWAFGHTHYSCDFLRDGKRFYSNQRGYRGEGTKFDPDQVVDI